ENEFAKQFEALAKKFRMEWRVAYSQNRQQAALFVSKEDHCLADLLYRHKSGELPCDFSFILSNHQTAKSLAEFYGIPFFYIPNQTNNKAKTEATILK